MTKLDSDTAPKSGSGTDTDRLSMSPQSIRRGGAEYADVNPDPVQTNAGRCPARQEHAPHGRRAWPLGRFPLMAATVLPAHIPTNAEASSHLVTAVSADGMIQVKDATTNQTVTMRLGVLSVSGQLTLVAVGPGSS